MTRAFWAAVVCAALSLAAIVPAAAQAEAEKPAVGSRSANVNGITIHYLVAGKASR